MTSRTECARTTARAAELQRQACRLRLATNHGFRGCRCRGGCVNRLQANVCSAFAAEDANHLTAFFKKALQLLGLLRRDPVGQRISMKIGVITQAVPRTIWFTRLRNTVLFTRGVVVPRIVASDT